MSDVGVPAAQRDPERTAGLRSVCPLVLADAPKHQSFPKEPISNIANSKCAQSETKKATHCTRAGTCPSTQARPLTPLVLAEAVPKSLFLCCCPNSVKKLLTDALNKNQYLRRLELQQIKDIVECMYERTYQRGEYVVKQGEPGNHLFVLAGRSAPV